MSGVRTEIPVRDKAVSSSNYIRYRADIGAEWSAVIATAQPQQQSSWAAATS